MEYNQAQKTHREDQRRVYSILNLWNGVRPKRFTTTILFQLQKYKSFEWDQAERIPEIVCFLFELSLLNLWNRTRPKRLTRRTLLEPGPYDLQGASTLLIVGMEPDPQDSRGGPLRALALLIFGMERCSNQNFQNCQSSALNLAQAIYKQDPLRASTLLIFGKEPGRTPFRDSREEVPNIRKIPLNNVKIK